MRTGKKRVLIWVAARSGVYTARHLEKHLQPHTAALSSVNSRNWVYQPMTPKLISGAIGLTYVVAPIRQLCPRT